MLCVFFPEKKTLLNDDFSEAVTKIMGAYRGQVVLAYYGLEEESEVTELPKAYHSRIIAMFRVRNGPEDDLSSFCCLRYLSCENNPAVFPPSLVALRYQEEKKSAKGVAYLFDNLVRSGSMKTLKHLTFYGSVTQYPVEIPGRFFRWIDTYLYIRFNNSM